MFSCSAPDDTNHQPIISEDTAKEISPKLYNGLITENYFTELSNDDKVIANVLLGAINALETLDKTTPNKIFGASVLIDLNTPYNVVVIGEDEENTVAPNNELSPEDFPSDIITYEEFMELETWERNLVGLISAGIEGIENTEKINNRAALATISFDKNKDYSNLFTNSIWIEEGLQTQRNQYYANRGPVEESSSFCIKMLGSGIGNCLNEVADAIDENGGSLIITVDRVDGEGKLCYKVSWDEP